MPAFVSNIFKSSLSRYIGLAVLVALLIFLSAFLYKKDFIFHPNNSDDATVVDPKEICSEDFLMASGTITYKNLNCGFYDGSETKSYYYGYIEDAYVDESKHLVVRVKTKMSSSLEPESVELVLGLYKNSYSWLTLNLGKVLFPDQDQYQIYEVFLDDKLLEYLREYTGKPVIFSILTDYSSIMAAETSSIPTKYQSDIAYRKKYFTSCTNIYLDSLTSINENCNFIYTGDLKLFTDNLEY